MAMEQDNESSVFPQEMIETILSKLPSKSLVRFKTVSKSWNTIISDPVFARTHLHRSKYSNSHNLFLRKSQFGSYTCFSLVKLLEDGNFQTVENFKGPDNFDKILCFCDGVLVLTDNSYHKFMFWNPSTRTETIFSCPYRFERALSCGLCHDPTTGKFKIVIIFDNSYLVFSGKSTKCTQTTLVTKKFEDNKSIGLDMSTSPVSVDGVVYWVIRRRHTKANGNIIIRYEIIYFDPIDEKFKILQKPENMVDECEQPIYLADLRGCLCVYCNATGGVKIWTKEKGNMGNCCWNELITIENVEKPISLFKPLCFMENKILVQLLSVSRLVLYNPLERTFGQVEDIMMFHGLVPYMDSLFFSARVIIQTQLAGRKRLRPN